jgi:hypothetical protein
MKKKTLLRTCLFALVVALGSLTPAISDLFVSKPLEAGPCPRIGCPSGFCKQDSDCTAAPGGICDHFCPSMGCCVY